MRGLYERRVIKIGEKREESWTERRLKASLTISANAARETQSEQQSSELRCGGRVECPVAGSNNMYMVKHNLEHGMYICAYIRVCVFV